MKIILDIPDTTMCAFFDFVYATDTGLNMQGHSIDSSRLFDGSEIKIAEVTPQKQEKEATT